MALTVTEVSSNITVWSPSSQANTTTSKVARGRFVGAPASHNTDGDGAVITTIGQDKSTQRNPGLSWRIVDITFDSSYATGGESLAASDVGLQTITEVLPGGGATPPGMICQWDQTNGKLALFRSNASATTVLNQVTSTADMSAFTFRCLVLGHSL